MLNALRNTSHFTPKPKRSIEVPEFNYELERYDYYPWEKMTVDDNMVKNYQMPLSESNCRSSLPDAVSFNSCSDDVLLKRTHSEFSKTNPFLFETFPNPFLISLNKYGELSDSRKHSSVPSVSEDSEKRLSGEIIITEKVEVIKSSSESKGSHLKSVRSRGADMTCNGRSSRSRPLRKSDRHKGHRRKKGKEGPEASCKNSSATEPNIKPKAKAIKPKNGLPRKTNDVETSDDDSYSDLAFNHQHLHALHRIRRQRKRASERDIVISFAPRTRASIVDRKEFYFRFGKEEQDAIATFSFLNDFSTSNSSDSDNDNFEEMNPCSSNCSDYLSKLPSDNSLNDSDLICTMVDHISLSDSCAESYDGTQD